MQVVATCKKPEEFPAIVHVDGTRRVLNPSLNIRGEPMVNVRSDADRFEQKYGVKVFS